MHAQHGAGQHRAVPELQLIGDVATANVQLSTVGKIRIISREVIFQPI